MPHPTQQSPRARGHAVPPSTEATLRALGVTSITVSGRRPLFVATLFGEGGSVIARGMAATVACALVAAVSDLDERAARCVLN